MDEKGEIVSGLVDLVEGYKQKIEDLEKEVNGLKEVIEGLVNLQPLPKLTKTRAV